MPSSRAIKQAIAPVIIFIILFMGGTLLSLHKPLWNDEIYTQIYSVENASWRSIVSGQLAEGNSYPLFYLLQKSFLALIHFQLPFQWDREWEVGEPRSQVLLRILPNLFMAGALTAIFIFFKRNFSIWTAVYALLVSLTSFMVLAYWAEARPYSLWFFLTTIQALLFLTKIQFPTSSRILKWLMGTHLLLALSVPLGILQITTVSFLLWLKGEKNLRKHLYLTATPVFIGLLYYSEAPRFPFRLEDPWPLLWANISQPQMFFILFYGIVALSRWFILEKKLPGTPPKINGSVRTAEFALLLTCVLLWTAALMIGLKIKSPSGLIGFGISSRFFIYLAPVGIIATTVFLDDLWGYFSGNLWMRVNLFIIAVGLLLWQPLLTASQILNLNIYY